MQSCTYPLPQPLTSLHCLNLLPQVLSALFTLHLLLFCLSQLPLKSLPDLRHTSQLLLQSTDLLVLGLQLCHPLHVLPSKLVVAHYHLLIVLLGLIQPREKHVHLSLGPFNLSL